MTFPWWFPGPGYYQGMPGILVNPDQGTPGYITDVSWPGYDQDTAGMLKYPGQEIFLWYPGQGMSRNLSGKRLVCLVAENSQGTTRGTKHFPGRYPGQDAAGCTRGRIGQVIYYKGLSTL